MTIVFPLCYIEMEGLRSDLGIQLGLRLSFLDSTHYSLLEIFSRDY